MLASDVMHKLHFHQIQKVIKVVFPHHISLIPDINILITQTPADITT